MRSRNMPSEKLLVVCAKNDQIAEQEAKLEVVLPAELYSLVLGLWLEQCLEA